MKKFGILSLFVISCFISTLSAKAFHLLLLGDTNSDNEDVHFNFASMSNLSHVRKSFAYIASASGIDFRATELTTTNNSLTLRHIKKWLREESVARDDVVILYYSGHGDRSRKTSSIWPRGNFLNDEVINFSEIIEKLFSKKAALYFVLLDCCNNYSKGPKIDKREFRLKKFDKHLIAAGCNDLFFKLYGLIIASGASPGEYGAFNHITGPEEDEDKSGGDFTNVFLNSFFHELRTASPQWESLLKKTKLETYRLSKKDSSYVHMPQYKIFLHHNRKSSRVYKRHLFEECAYHTKKFLNKGIDTAEVLLPVCSCFSGPSIDEFEDEK